MVSEFSRRFLVTVIIIMFSIYVLFDKASKTCCVLEVEKTAFPTFKISQTVIV